MDLNSQLAAVELAWSLADDATPTPEQAETLAAFTGWGAFAPAFAATPTEAWLRVADRLDAAMPAEAFAIASEQVDTSFFTPAPITAAVYRLLEETGFTGGNILEPGCGAGAFLSAAPAGWEVQFTGVELDPTSALIATLLHPNATILTGKLESTVVREDHFDAAIGNVPFSSVRVHDKEGRGGSLHNYFIRRAVDAIRPGGYVILVTSRHTIDAGTGLAAALNDMDGAAFIGAVRLPAGAFFDAGTDAVTDIVVLRKNDSTHTQAPWEFPADTESTPAGHDWYGRPQYTTTDNRLPITEPVRPGLTISDTPKVSAYWAAHPEHIAGRMLATGFERAPITVHTDTPDTAITAAVAALAAILPPLTPQTRTDDLSDVILADADGRKEGSFHVIDGALHRVTSGQLAPVRAHRELVALVALRDLAVRLLDAEANMHTPDEQIAPLRAETLAAYQAYVTTFGHLNRGTLVEGKPDEDTGLPALSWRRPTMGGFRRDPDAALVMALEVYDQDTGEAGPAPILTRRVNRLPEPIERVDTAAEALAVSLGETGRVDLDRIAGLLGLTGPAAVVEHAVTDALGELVYDDHGQWVPASEYLSGNVRAKLDAARAAGNARNIAALESVLPAELGPLDITMTLGSPFVTTGDVETFLREEMGVRWPSVHRVEGMGVWEVDEATSDAAAQMKWATTDTTPAYLVECALNARMPEVTDRVWNAERGTYVRVRNLPATAAANEKLELIRDRFSTWVWEDEDRATRICAAYNRDLNSHVTRTYTGAGLTFPGLSAEVTPWAHQRAAVERMASTPRALLAHPVGAGKAQPMDSLILTPTGFRRMGDFMVGDEVIAPDGTTTHVTGVFPQGPLDVYRVTFTDGAVAECNDEHLWNVQTINMRCDNPENWHTMTLREIMDRGLTNGRNQPFWLVPIAEAADFDSGEPRPVDPYLVGALLGDGNLTVATINFTSADPEILDYVRAALPDGVELVKKISSPYDYTIRTTDKSNRRYTNPLIGQLRDLDMMGPDARHKRVPAAYLNAPRDARIAVLQGLMDTDGYVKAKVSRGATVRPVGSGIEFGSSSPRLIADVSWLVRSLGGVVTPAQSRKSINGVVHTRVRFKLPEGVNPFRLPRKADLHVAAQHFTPRRAIKSVELIGRKPMQCISVAHEDRLYVTNDFVVTHNTLEMVMGARTLRQFGLANKPLIVVPNHLLDQIAREAQQAYPTGRFLIATKDDLVRDARRLFAARCATGDWDAVIMTHSAFTSIPVHPETEKEWLDEQKFELKWRLQDATGGRKDKGPKAVARAIRALESRVAQLRSNAVTDPDAIWFEQLGVDYLMVDEAHLFRRLDTGSSNRENALTGGSSKRATDLLVKIETLAARRPAGAPVVALFTGTPWSNTLAETWVWQRYLQPDTLQAIDLLAFDSWVSAFVRYETNIEVSPDGSGFRMQRRPVEMANAPEVKTMLAQVADLIDPASLGLNRPDFTVNTVVVDPTPEQREYVRDLAVRADGIRNKTADKRAKLDGGETDDSMLLVCNDGRKVALDPRLVGLDEQSAKIERLADLAAAAYRENRDRTFGSHPTPGGYQLAFLDLGTPKPAGTSTYGRVRRAVADRGVPAHMIRFVHEATTDKARAALFAACRDGEVALLIGSTAKVGMGTNVQTRLTHLWHVDAPWLPSDVIQREGRAIRPGNLAGHVTITRLVTEGTFDAYTWQALERKSRSFDALYATSATARSIEDVSAATLSYGQVKALASGNPLLMEQATAQAAVKKLQLMRSVHLQSVRKAEQTARALDDDAAARRRGAALSREAATVVGPATEAELADLARAATGWTKISRDTWGGISAGTAQARWRGVALRPRHTDGRLTSVAILHRYETIAEVSVFAGQVRRGPEKLAETIVGLVDEVLDGLRSRAARAETHAAQAEAEAEASRVAASAAVFDGETDLTAAVSRLAEIDAQIADAAIAASTRQPVAA